MLKKYNGKEFDRIKRLKKYSTVFKNSLKFFYPFFWKCIYVKTPPLVILLFTFISLFIFPCVGIK